ncbi:hypothetical protein GDO81_005535 [Engystomops pustulosus]|uniref:Ig-like domain-containing protein n=1 Tax=Engystomops pustulosus TaxID=76066 RepID=A0AAV7CPK3_ENGPU|nr:hypothetical protein GDO81_005535 [Engystomops pustulosus]
MKLILLMSILCDILLNLTETASKNIAPRITEPLNNYNIQVKAGSTIDLSCSALIESESFLNATMIYWLINGTFSEFYHNVKEGHQRLSKKGNQYYSNIVLYIDGVAQELYNIPITCIASSPWGGDNATLYLRAYKTGNYMWAVTIPLCIVILVLLVACAYHFI